LDSSKDILEHIHKKVDADVLMSRLISQLRNSKKTIVELLKENIKKDDIRNHSYMSHIIYCLKNVSADELKVKNYLMEELYYYESEHQNVISDIIHKETIVETVYRNTIRSLIISLKEISEWNWEDLFEEVSPIEKVLRKDPAGVYKLMDFQTRDLYRHKIEKIARLFNIEERRIAQKALYIAIKESNKSKKLHVGNFIIGREKNRLYENLDTKKRMVLGIKNKLHSMRGIFYFFGIFILFAILVTALFIYIANFSAGMQTWEIAVLMLSILIPSFGVCIEVLNRISVAIVPPTEVLSMDFSNNIPDRYRTFVVMPVILGSLQQVDEYVKKLEKYYLGNIQDNLYFALLGDFKDAPVKETAEDRTIIFAAKKAIEELNEKYPSETLKFNLFVRFREYNKFEDCWMGWERKRGKLDEFNSLLLGDKDTTYDVILCNKKILTTFRYVITLDSDTELIRESAVKLIGIMAHPLNRPVFNKAKNKIVEGYSIVQSEIRNRLSSVKYSVFSNLFANNPGIDAYSTLVSDVYHDTFNDGIFFGKGIYDVRVFNKLFYGKIPENSVLSHDLLESCYARCAFASNIKLMDKYPSGLISYTKREHRWIRGDWQLLPWLFKKSPIGGLSKWKVFDNMRRSLTQISWTILILTNLLLFPQNPFLWMCFIFFSPTIQFLFSVKIIYQKIKHPESSMCFKNIFTNLFKIIAQGLLVFILIPLRAYVSADAIIRSLYRTLFSHKKMLEWSTSESIEKGIKNTLKANLTLMGQSVVAGAIFVLSSLLVPSLSGKIIAVAVGSVWLVSPVIAYLVSIPSSLEKKLFFQEDDLSLLRRHARKIWSFVEDHSGESTNWICPDNLQELPIKKITTKTSPTNIGLQLMSILTARDMGYVSIKSFIERCGNVIQTIRSMDKWHGHLYNWYDIESLTVLPPKYISTVDSGNFVGYMIVLKNALLALPGLPVITQKYIDGLCDTLLLSGIDYSIISTEKISLESWSNVLNEIKGLTEKETKAGENEKWVKKLDQICKEFLDELEWLSFSEAADLNNSISDIAQSGNKEADKLLDEIYELTKQIDKIITDTDFKYLYDKKQRLFRIGYNLESQKLDLSKYDLLASEARQASFIAIAKGDVSQKHWFKLGRPLTIANHMQSLVSWSGSMFEYLMPELIIKSVPNSVISQSCIAMVLSQIKYGKKKKVPWGISESQYYRFDTDSNYQYRAFGISDLSFQSSMQNVLVIAPYATMLALNVLPGETISNMKRLISLGAEGDYGFYESIDYTVPDTPSVKEYTIIKSYMMHHQGMSLVAINNAVNNSIMQKRFHCEPIIQATEILLEEYNPMNLFTLNSKEYNLKVTPLPGSLKISETRHYTNPILPYPCAHVLCNDNYMIMMTTGGTGFSKCKDIMVNRWRSDLVSNLYGTFFYIRNISTKDTWSCTYYPLIKEPDEYEAIFSHDKIEYLRKDYEVKTHTEVTVSPIDNVEIRRISVCNESDKDISIEITSYLELVNDKFNSDLAHPAFSKLFNEIEYLHGMDMLVAKRRPREKNESKRYIVHFVLCDGKLQKNIEYETDKKRFVGRGNTLQNPAAINNNLSLSNTDGQTTDPIISLRAAIGIEPGKTSTVAFITGFCDTYSDVLALHHKYGLSYSLNDIFELAYVYSELEMLYLNMTSHQINLIQDIVGMIYYPSNLFRADSKIIKRNTKSQASLWRFGISGDHPILLLRISDEEDIRSVKDAIRAYEFFKKNLIQVDLVLLNEQTSGYSNELNSTLFRLTSNLRMYDENPQQRNIFILQADMLASEEMDLLLTVSRMVINADTGFSYWFTKEALIEKSKAKYKEPDYFAKKNCGRLIPTESIFRGNSVFKNIKTEKTRRNVSEFFNNIGGFINNGEEYEIKIQEGQKTPVPWINVIANEHFGFHISESGSGYTWAENSRENKLTSWSNDPVIDPPSEIIYIRDEETGEYTTPTCTPIDDNGTYTITHGKGYSVFEHQSIELKQKMTVFASKKDPAKIWIISLKNQSKEDKDVSLFLYLEWVLGVTREETSPYLVTGMNEQINTMTVENVYSTNFGARYAFVSSSEKIVSYTGDRMEFIGPKGSFRNPAAIREKELSNNTGAEYDPCSAIMITIKIRPDETKEIAFVMGQVQNYQQVSSIVEKYSNVQNATQELEHVKVDWKNIMSQLRVKTPDRAMNILINNWLLYQVISCRLYARAAFYQCGGAIGFRDQLQDVLSLLNVDPKKVRDQILLCCSRQFVEGDVQHWWHQHTGQGVRTKISDDLLWLPYVTALYIKSTGDETILNEKVDYITGPLLKPEEAEIYFIPGVAKAPESVNKHCIKAIERSLSFGSHGLPLIGAGDWNDGMNRVGVNGKGESVWLGWFMYTVLDMFTSFCKTEKNEDKKDRYMKIAKEIIENIEKHAWDGQWYLRAFFDD
jgi:cyclic beta-1,2-glucan synthetase